MKTLKTPAFNLDEPGSIIYDGKMAVKGKRITAVGQSFKIKANRDAFKTDSVTYLKECDLTDEERTRILDRDWKWMLAQGGHIQALQRIATADGQYLFHIAAHNCGVGVDELIKACPRRVSELGGYDE